MELLLERIDSPLAEVREAARRELAGFDIYRALEIFGHLDLSMQKAVGNLVQKIDPDTPHKLRNEILHAIRSKRIRAARAAVSMNLQMQLADAFLVMARDSDNHVRRTATEVLGTIRSREAVELLLELTHDPSPRVRDAAVVAVAGLQGERGPANPAEEITPDILETWR
jgi:HEAT repeat protein